MSFTVTGWNLADGLSDAARADRIVDRVLELDTDVAVFPEAYDARKEVAIAQPVALLERAGYQVEHVAYDDGLGYPRQHGFMAISRLPSEFEIAKLATRNTLALSIEDPEEKSPVTILGAHFDHTTESLRREQAESSVAYLRLRGNPGVLVGDLNSLHKDMWLARIMRSRLVRRVGLALPRNELFDHVRNLSSMSEGTALPVLEAAGLRDVDPVGQATGLAPLYIAQLDHIFYGPQLLWTAFDVLLARRLSDHRPLRASFSVIT